MSITIREEAPGAQPAKPAEARFDASDAMILLAFLCVESGVSAIYWPAALILAGVILYLAAAAIARRPKERK